MCCFFLNTKAISSLCYMSQPVAVFQSLWNLSQSWQRILILIIPPGQYRLSAFLSTGEKSITNYTMPFFIHNLLYYLLNPHYKWLWVSVPDFFFPFNIVYINFYSFFFLATILFDTSVQKWHIPNVQTP